MVLPSRPTTTRQAHPLYIARFVPLKTGTMPVPIVSSASFPRRPAGEDHTATERPNATNRSTRRVAWHPVPHGLDRACPSVFRQILTTPSRLPAATALPSGEIATDQTSLGSEVCHTILPVSVSHSSNTPVGNVCGRDRLERGCLAAPPTASSLPSGDDANTCGYPIACRSIRFRSCLPVFRSQKLIRIPSV